MTRKETILHLLETISYIESLHDVPEEIWKTPIQEGKWSLAELVGHFARWDLFVTEQRIPYILKGELLPKGPKADEVNAVSSQQSRTKSREQIIQEFVSARLLKLRAVRSIDDSFWDETISIGSNVIHLANYFEGLAEHDVHHFKEIDGFLRQLNIHKPLDLYMVKK